MPNTDPGSAAADTEPARAVLLEVVKGLHDEKELLFGIGAGVVLVGVLAATTSIALVAIVAAVLLLALAAWVYGETRRVRSRPPTPRARIRAVAEVEDAKVIRSPGANVRDAFGGADVNAHVHANRAHIEDSRLGNVTIGPTSNEDPHGD